MKTSTLLAIAAAGVAAYALSRPRALANPPPNTRPPTTTQTPGTSTRSQIERAGVQIGTQVASRLANEAVDWISSWGDTEGGAVPPGGVSGYDPGLGLYNF